MSLHGLRTIERVFVFIVTGHAGSSARKFMLSQKIISSLIIYLETSFWCLDPCFSTQGNHLKWLDNSRTVMEAYIRPYYHKNKVKQLIHQYFPQ